MKKVIRHLIVALCMIIAPLSVNAQELIIKTSYSEYVIPLNDSFAIVPSGTNLFIFASNSDRMTMVQFSDITGISYRGPSGGTSDGLKGDVNEDGWVDVADISAVIDIMAGKDVNLQLGPVETKTYTVNGVSFTMIGVEGGTFQMGSDDSDAYDDARPVHQVTLSSFSIGQTEVTQALWNAVMGQKPTSDGKQWSSTYGLGDNYPAYYVNWNDCQEFITKLNQLTGQQFRLPTEAEWEYAARGGNKNQGCKYSGSNTIDDVAWYDYNLSEMESDTGYGTQPVATKQSNELGIYDMTGNVWEWCSDWYGDYTSDAQTNPTGPASGSGRVLRGGGWYTFTKRLCRVSFRESYLPSSRDYDLGVRLALNVAPLSVNAQELIIKTSNSEMVIPLNDSFSIVPSGSNLMIYDSNNDRPTMVQLSDITGISYRSTSGGTSDGLKGDVNEDKTVDVADIAAVIDIMAGKEVADEKAYTTCPNENHPHWIDLGLPSGTQWRCCNEGTSKPEDYGGYYTFDEAQAYNPPSLDLIKELLNNTTSVWTTQNGVYGRKFTGSNGDSVFLPAAGAVFDGELDYVGSDGYYWSSTPYDEIRAYGLGFDSGSADWGYYYYRYYGRSVRPVR
ncbi:MAG: SUMF1/EgtB/PvdO family nonheme iron enzyme [Prevotella sp.]|nr:SUMF1/EgtB/PvdO family nonheme iron enzyme [Prevotella sp.]